MTVRSHSCERSALICCLHRIFLQAFVQLQQASNQESEASPKCSTCSLILCTTVASSWTQCAAKCKPNATDEVPECDMPPKNIERRCVPIFLCFQHVQCSRNDEACTSNNLWYPIYAVGEWLGHVIYDAGQGSDTSNAENSRATELTEASEEAKFVQVVRLER